MCMYRPIYFTFPCTVLCLTNWIEHTTLPLTKYLVHVENALILFYLLLTICLYKVCPNIATSYQIWIGFCSTIILAPPRKKLSPPRIWSYFILNNTWLVKWSLMVFIKYYVYLILFTQVYMCSSAILLYDSPMSVAMLHVYAILYTNVPGQCNCWLYGGIPSM